MRRRDVFIGAGAGVAASAAGVQAEAAPRDRRAAFEAVLGAMPCRSKPEVAVIETVAIEGGTRRKISWVAERGDARLKTPDDVVRAYLFTPTGAERRRTSAILAIHQDGPQSHIGKSEPAGLAGDPEQFYGLEMFRRGHVVLCPDRPEHAERRRVDPNDLTSIDPDRDDRLADHRAGQMIVTGRTLLGKEVHDLMSATDVLASLPGVDPDRIGSIGHSAGGVMGMFHMFMDPRIRAGVSSCGVFGFADFYAEDAPKRRIARVAPPGLLDLGDSGDYLALIAPRPVMLTRGLWEWGAEDHWRDFSERHVADTRRLEATARTTHGTGPGSTLDVVYFDEAGGQHAIPPGVKARIYGWLDAKLA